MGCGNIATIFRYMPMSKIHFKSPLNKSIIPSPKYNLIGYSIIKQLTIIAVLQPKVNAWSFFGLFDVQSGYMITRD
jgi:hypothetical protein